MSITVRFPRAWWLLAAAFFQFVSGTASAQSVNQSFLQIDPNYAQNLFGVAKSIPKGPLSGVAVLQSGDVIVAECPGSGENTRLHRYSAASTFVDATTGQTLHTETILNAPNAGCGLTLGLDGSLYTNVADKTFGVAKIDPATGATITKFTGAPTGNALGIATNPVTGHLVYAGATCFPAATNPTNCTLYDLDPVTGAATPFITLDTKQYLFVDGLEYDTTGTFLFATNRAAVGATQNSTINKFDLLVIGGTPGSAAVVQDITTSAAPIGIAFHEASPKFVILNNQDATVTRYDFSNDDYSTPPAQTVFASGGFRGDLLQVGPDRCVYLTQNGVRYDSGVVSRSANAIVQVCGGFTPPPGITPNPDAIPPVTTATLTPAANANGWNKTAVTVGLSAVDNVGGSGVKNIVYSATGAQTIAATSVVGDQTSFSVANEGTTTVLFRASDFAGNVEPPETAVVKIDMTPPTITSSRTPAADVNGWNTTAVTVSFTCTDTPSGSGIPAANMPLPTTVNTDGMNQSVTGVCTDAAGNSVSTTVQNINIDTLAPVTTASLSPKANPAGWNKSDVTVTLKGTDATSGVAQITYSVAGAQVVPLTTIAGTPATIVINTEGASTITFFSTDKAGNIEVAKTVVVQLDKTPPAISGTAAPAPNAAGWNNTPVTVTFTCSDAVPGSGLATPTPIPAVTLSKDGASQSVTRSCTDVAGNTSTATVSNINIDTAPAVTTAVFSAKPNAAGWNNADVTITLNAVDRLPKGVDDQNAASGVAQISYSVNGGAPMTVAASSAAVLVNTEGSTTIAFFSTDTAGNVEMTKSVTVKLDKTPPTVAGSASPGPNAFGWNTTGVTVTFTCSDGSSGLAAGSPPPPTAVATEGAGQSVTGTCTDLAGNSATATVANINIDLHPPVLTVPSPIVAIAASSAGAPIAFAVSAFDPGFGSVPATCSAVSGATFAIGVTTVSCSASDGHGYSASGAFTITVLSEPPAAIDDVATTLEATPVAINVTANDLGAEGDVLTIIGIPSAPVHGTAVVTAPGVITYTPADGFVGQETFTYAITGGHGGSAVASVTVTVSRLARFVVLSNDYTFLGDRTVVRTGDVGANTPPTPKHSHKWIDDHDKDDLTLWFDERATMQQPTSRVVGDTVRLDAGASVYNLVTGGIVKGSRGAVLGSVSSPNAMPFTTLPAMPALAAGTQDVTVMPGKVTTLAPGNYDDVHALWGGTLILTGGLYQMTELDLEAFSTVIVRGPSELRIAYDVDADWGVRIMLDPAIAGLKASQVVMYVAGEDRNIHHNFSDWKRPTLVEFDGGNLIQANIYAPNATIRIGNRSKATGAFIGEHVLIGDDNELTLDSAFK